jgi:Domain of unknown function (DUF4347)
MTSPLHSSSSALQATSTQTMLNHNSFMTGTKSVTEIATQSTLVVFDNRVQDLGVLYQALLPEAIGYTIDAGADGLVEITRLLAESGAKRLAIVAHGEPGVVKLGREVIDASVLAARAGLLQEWCVEEISLYSCEVGADAEFVGALEQLTNAKVIASNKTVGCADKGGDWLIAQNVVSPCFNLESVATYQHTLNITAASYVSGYD